jgi:2-amino-4-hydroxy-6-hydroxymethyldihydropteridine diphosphokinase
VRTLAAIALGANIGPREESLSRAVELLDHSDSFEIWAVSSLYESPPWGDSDQPDFLNAVVVGEADGEPAALLDHLKWCEATIGKTTVRRWGPRVIDLDLLAVGDVVSSAADLELPHPRMAGRPFVYLPLREACAGLALPDSWGAHLVASEEGKSLEAVTRQRSAEGVFPSRPASRRVELMLRGEEETAALARAVARHAKPGDVVALAGPLGAGKSLFVRAFARELGVSGSLPSPTYTLCREYRSGRLSLQHWDFYRLESEEDLESAGFPPAAGEFDVLAIEWADRFPEALAAQAVTRVELEPIDGHDDHRRARLEMPAGSLALRSEIGVLMGGER